MNMLYVGFIIFINYLYIFYKHLNTGFSSILTSKSISRIFSSRILNTVYNLHKYKLKYTYL